MSGTPGTTMVMQVPGRAVIMLEKLQQRAPWQSLVDLQTIAAQLHLPRLHWQCDDVWGVTGTARGSQSRVQSAVEEWADAFAVEVLTREPKWMRDTDPSRVLVAGFVSAQIHLPGLDVTVAGRLSGKGGAL